MLCASLSAAQAQKIWHRDVDDVGLKIQQLPLDEPAMPSARRYSGRAGQRDGGHRNELAPVRKGRPVGGGREYQDLDAMGLQKADQAVQGQRDAVGDVVVRTGDQRDPKRAAANVLPTRYSTSRRSFSSSWATTGTVS